MAHLHSQQITKAGEETQQNAFAVNVHLWMAMAYSTITVAFLTEIITIPIIWIRQEKPPNQISQSYKKWNS